MTQARKNPLNPLHLCKTDYYFIFVFIAIEFLLRIMFAAFGAMPAGHDGFQRFYLQKYFFDEACATGQIVEWIPYITHGTVSTWWAVIIGSPVLTALNPFAFLFNGADFRYIFWFSEGFDRFLLFCGLGLLIRYNSRFSGASWTAALLTSLSISDIIQPWHNLRIFFLLPWSFFFLQLFFAYGKWRFLALSALFAIFQTYCGLPYFSVAISFIIFLFYTSLVIACPKSAIAHFKTIVKKPIKASICIAAILLLSAIYIYSNIAGTSQIVNYNPGRSNDGSVDLETFLTYAKIPNHTNWLETATGISPCVDYTLFISTLFFVFSITGMVFSFQKPDSSGKAFFAFGIFLYLLSIGSIVATVAYYLWPGMNYMRHLSLLAPVLKIPIAYFAAIGIHKLLIEKNAVVSLVPKYVFFILSCVVFVFTLWPIFSADGMNFWLNIMGERKVLPHPDLNPDYIKFTSIISATISAIALICILFLWTKKWKIFYLGVFGILLFSSLLFRIERDLRAVLLLNLDQINRLCTISQPEYVNARIDSLKAYADEVFTAQSTLWPSAFRYWSESVFWRQEELGSSLRVDHWLKPLDFLWKVFAPPISPTDPPLGFFPYRGFIFPSDAFLKNISGSSRAKAIFYKSWKSIERSDLSSALLFANNADVLLIPIAVEDENSPNHESPVPNEPVKPSFFSSNKVVFDQQFEGEGYLYYADTMHPGWKCYIDGVPTAIHEAFGTYKAVWVPVGAQRIEFRFKLPAFQFVHRFFTLLAFLILGFTALFLLNGRPASQKWDQLWSN